jgi:hypothetical protein
MNVWFEIQARDPYGNWVRVDQSDDWDDANDRKDVGDLIVVRVGTPAPF